MKLSIVIPVYNEESTIKTIIERVEKLSLPVGIQKEIIIIDDASTDTTPDILSQYSSRLHIIRHEKNRGKGAAVRSGFLASTGDIVVIQDADLEYDPLDLPTMLEPIMSGKADVVYGSRLMTNKPHRVMYFWHYLGNIFLTLISNICTNLNLTDMEICYKMMTREVLEDIKMKLTSERFGIEPEITARIKHYRIFEVGISYSGRTYKEGKKINWKDGVAALWHIVRFNLLS
ncbi:MAG: glycosyltransferase family 2 protein [Patescibacteria group bacterium]